jgi:putative membrane protein
MNDSESSRIRQILGWGIIGIISVIGVSIVLSIYFGARPHGLGFPFSFGWLGGIFLIFIVFWLARWFFWPRRGYYSHQHRNAESILKERYAKGEITRDQFEQMMSDVHSKD